MKDVWADGLDTAAAATASGTHWQPCRLTWSSTSGDKAREVRALGQQLQLCGCCTCNLAGVHQLDENNRQVALLEVAELLQPCLACV